MILNIKKNEEKKIIFDILGFNSFGFIINMINNGGFAFYNYGTSINYIMTHEEDEKLKRVKLEHDKYKQYFN